MKPTFFDIVLQNSKLKNDQNNQNAPQPPSQKRWHENPITVFLAFFLFAYVLYLGMGVISSKFSIIPAFSYIEILKLYASAAIIKRFFS